MVWSILRFCGGRVAETSDSIIGDVVRHGEINHSLFVTPIQFYSAEEFAFPVHRDLIILF